MPDDLRDRIAAVLAEADGMPWKMWSRPSQDGYLLRADAVIAELGVDCIYRYACRHCGDFWFDTSGRMQRFALLHGKSHAKSRLHDGVKHPPTVPKE